MHTTASVSGTLCTTVYSNPVENTVSIAKIDQARDETIAHYGRCRGTDDTSWWLAYSRRLQEISRQVEVHSNPVERVISIEQARDETIAGHDKCRGTDDTSWWLAYSRRLQEKS